MDGELNLSAERYVLSRYVEPCCCHQGAGFFVLAVFIARLTSRRLVTQRIVPPGSMDDGDEPKDLPVGIEAGA